MAKIPDASDLRMGAPRPTRGVPNVVGVAGPTQDVANAMTANVQQAGAGFAALSDSMVRVEQVATRMQTRQDAVARARTTGAVNETIAAELRRLSTEGDLSDVGTIQNFSGFVNTTITKALGEHQGSPDSRAMLAQLLEGTRAQFVDQAAAASFTAQQELVSGQLDAQLAPLVTIASQSPGQLPDLFARWDMAVANMAPALTPAEEEQRRTIGRAQMLGATIENFMATAQYGEARELLNDPTLQGFLTADQQRDYMFRINAAEAEVARAEAARAGTVNRLTAAGVDPQSAALIAEGVDPRILQPSETFRTLSPTELQEAGFPASAVVQQSSSGELKVVHEGGILKPGDAVKIEADLRDDFDRQSQDFEAQQQQMFSMQSLAGDTTGASDIALVFAFFKAMDPQSVVREGEFAAAASATGLPTQMVQALQRLDTGEILTPDMREQLVATAQTFYAQALTDQVAREEFYRGLAENAGVAPGNVVRTRVRTTQSGDADTGKFSTMTDDEILAVDLSALTKEERDQLSAELDRRGF